MYVTKKTFNGKSHNSLLKLESSPKISNSGRERTFKCCWQRNISNDVIIITSEILVLFNPTNST